MLDWQVGMVAISPDGTMMAAQENKGTGAQAFVLIETASWRRIYAFDHNKSVRSLHFRFLFLGVALMFIAFQIPFSPPRSAKLAPNTPNIADTIACVSHHSLWSYMGNM